MTSSILVAWDFFGVLNAVEGLAPILRHIQEKGGTQIVVSHSSQFEIEEYLDKHGLKQYIYAVYGAEWLRNDVSLGKAPALQDFMVKSGPFDQCLMIGDSLSDIADAHEAKIKACLFDPNGYYKQVDTGADFVIDDLGAVVELIDKLLSV